MLFTMPSWKQVNPPYKFEWAERTIPVSKGIDNDIYSIVDDSPNACEMWKAIERLKQGESINVQNLETHLFWEFGKFTSRDGETLESYYSRFYKMMNELVRYKCKVTNHQVDVQFLLKLQPEWQMFVTIVNQSQELKIVSYHKLYDILKQHQNEVNEIRAGRRSTPQQAATRNRGKAIVNSPQPTYDQEPEMGTKDDTLSKEKEIDELMDLMSLSFKKIYKPTNNNLITSSNTSRANQDNTPRINRGIGYDNQRAVNINGARECQKPEQAKDAAYQKEKMLLYQELEAHYLYMAQIQEVTPDVANNSGPIFDAEPLQKERLTRMKIKILLENSLIEKLKYEIDESKDHNKLLESSNKNLVDKLKSEIENFKNKNKCLESSNNHFKEANTELEKNNQLMFKDLKKFQAELDRTKMHMVVPISTREPKQTVNQYVATPLKKIFDAESTNQKPRSTTRNQCEHISKKCRWWYSKITPPGYKWKLKSSAMNVKPNVSLPLRKKSRNANTLEPMTLRKSTLSNTPLYFNSFAAHRDNTVHHRLWVT
ncbi:hypothetical protein Tco_0628673 [Tanacetum coccineum]|uniref:Gag-Pol polyprotein n=1 Tax=Tanacetum coccineum TaxID=301880 RepID=A0ABQ4WR07_9ASTR